MNIRIFLISLFLFNFMYLSPDRKHWIDLVYERFPVVKYKVNPLMIGFNTGSKESIIDAIRSSSDFWSFRSGDAHFQFSYNGTTTNSPLAFNEIACDEDGKQRIRETDNLVFASNTGDPDCSGQACTYIWSCTDKNEILHFDMQINSREYEWDTGTNHKKSFNLTTVAAKQFGQILGLDHCPLGLNAESCVGEVASRGTSDPSSDSLLYRFIDAEVIRNSLSSDDRAGLQSLYGSISPEEVTMKSEMNSFYSLADSICNPNPCVIPEEDISTYQLSPEEVQARNDHNQYIKDQGSSYRTAIYDMTQMLKQLHQDSFVETGKSAESFLLGTIRNRQEDIANQENEMLNRSRQILAIQIKNRKLILAEYRNEFDSDFLRFLEAELKLLIQMRRDIIQRSKQ